MTPTPVHQLPDAVTTAHIADAVDAEREATLANREARAAAWAATRTAGTPEARAHFQEAAAWAVAAEAWAQAANTAATKSGHHPTAVQSATGADQATGYAKGQVRLAAKAARVRP